MDQITRWRPDTCGCQIDLLWDSDAPDDARELTVVGIEPCPLHAADVPDAAPLPARYKRRADGGLDAQSREGERTRAVFGRDVRLAAAGAKVVDDNRRKNDAVNALAEHVGRPASEIVWRFDEARRLHLIAPKGTVRSAALAAVRAKVADVEID